MDATYRVLNGQLKLAVKLLINFVIYHIGEDPDTVGIESRFVGWI